MKAQVHFTRDELHWEPRLAIKPLAEFTRRAGAAGEIRPQRFAYFRLLARNLPLLEQRTLTDKGIFYTPGGLPRAERELATATVASKINGCIYCASVHARKAAQLAKDETAIETLLAVTPETVKRRADAGMAGADRFRRRDFRYPPPVRRLTTLPPSSNRGWIPSPGWIYCNRRPSLPGPTG